MRWLWKVQLKWTALASLFACTHSHTVRMKKVDLSTRGLRRRLSDRIPCEEQIAHSSVRVRLRGAPKQNEVMPPIERGEPQLRMARGRSSRDEEFMPKFKTATPALAAELRLLAMACGQRSTR